MKTIEFVPPPTSPELKTRTAPPPPANGPQAPWVARAQAQASNVLITPPPETIPAAPVDEPTVPWANATQVKSVLVVDDDRMWLSAVSRAMESEGFKVQTASNANTALKTLREASFDLIVSDLRMPRMDGMEFRDAIVSNAGAASIPFIFLSGSIDADDRSVARKLGVSHLVDKSGTLEHLTSLAHELTQIAA